MIFIKPCLTVRRLRENITQAFAKAWEIEPDEGITILLPEYPEPRISEEEIAKMTPMGRERYQILRDQSMSYKRVENYISPNAYIHPKHWYGKPKDDYRLTYSGLQEETGCGLGYATAIDEYHQRIRTRRIKEIKKRFPLITGGMILITGIAAVLTKTVKGYQ